MVWFSIVKEYANLARMFPIDAYPTHPIERRWQELGNGMFPRPSGRCQPNARSEIAILYYDLLKVTKGLSGRALRRLPVLAHARAIRRGASVTLFTNPTAETASPSSLTNGVRPKQRARTAEKWLQDMEAVVGESRAQLERLE